MASQKSYVTKMKKSVVVFSDRMKYDVDITNKTQKLLRISNANKQHFMFAQIGPRYDSQVGALRNTRSFTD